MLETLMNEFKPMPIISDTAIHYYKKLPMALGTGGTKAIATKTMKIVKLDSYFDILVTADDVKNHKPHPDTFLQAAEQLGISPERCLVFEDGEPGINAAKAANMEVLDIRKVTPKSDYSESL